MTEGGDPARTRARGEPRAARPRIDGYGIPDHEDGLLPWSWAEGHLEPALTYWVGTVRPDGRPHLMPIWGVWLDGGLWFEGGFGTRRARNLEANPAAVVTVHIDDDAALVVEGLVELHVDPPAELEQRLLDAFRKYLATPHQYEADPANWRTGSGGGLWCLRPTVAFGWTRFPEDTTRWEFGPG